MLSKTTKRNAEKRPGTLKYLPLLRSHCNATKLTVSCTFQLFYCKALTDHMNGASNSSSLRAAFSYCIQQVHSYDYEHYLCLLHLPQSLRKAAFALRAFNIETAKARDNVSDAKLALVRLLWWRDIIDNIYKNKVAEHPVAQSLASVINEHKLSKHWFNRSIKARIEDTEMETPPVSLADLEQYSENTASVLLYLMLQAGGIQSTSADHAASHIGKASGLVLLLRATAYHASRRRSYIPLEIAGKHGLSQEEIYRGKHKEALENTIFEIASTANTHLEKARELSSNVPKAALPVLLPAVPAQILLDSLRNTHFNVFDPTLTRGISDLLDTWNMEGSTVAYVGVDTKFVGVFSVADRIRPEAAKAVNKLKVGEIEVHAQLLPEDKLRFIGQLKQEGMTAMVGDGTNDAPALAAADVGIVMDVEGSAVAMESAEIDLMSNDIRKIAGAVKIGWNQ